MGMSRRKFAHRDADVVSAVAGVVAAAVVVIIHDDAVRVAGIIIPRTDVVMFCWTT